MELSEKIALYGSVAVAGLAKNVGKTVTLNYLLRESHRKGLPVGVTSIGIDGESLDLVTSTPKPEIRLGEGVLFATSEAHYRLRKIESEVVGLSRRSTSLGRVVTARTLSGGKVLLSGPSDTASLSFLIKEFNDLGAATVLVDGALSRMSLASPAVTEAMVLATGAAVSPDIAGIVAKTAHACFLTKLPAADPALSLRLASLPAGVWGIDEDGEPHSLGIASAVDLEKAKQKIFEFGTTVYASGVVSGAFVKYLSMQKEIAFTKLIVRDFTRIFADAPTLKVFFARGGKIEVLNRTRLLALTVNPINPKGYRVDRERLIAELQKKVDVPVVYINPKDNRN